MASLGEQAVGSIVKLNVGGTPWNFIVVQQGNPNSSLYDVSCDGVWLLMEAIYEKRKAHSSQINDYENLEIRTYLDSTFLGLFDSAVQGVIKQVKIPYRPGRGQGTTVANGANGLSTKIFLLSASEIGGNLKYCVDIGSILAYFNGASDAMRIAYYNGSASEWWLRTPHATGFGQSLNYVNTSGTNVAKGANYSCGVRPCLILPYELNVSDSGLVDGTIASAGAITGTVIINGVQRELTGKGYININGVLRELSDSQVNIGGTLRSTKG